MRLRRYTGVQAGSPKETVLWTDGVRWALVEPLLPLPPLVGRPPEWSPWPLRRTFRTSDGLRPVRRLARRRPLLPLDWRQRPLERVSLVGVSHQSIRQ